MDKNKGKLIHNFQSNQEKSERKEYFNRIILFIILMFYIYIISFFNSDFRDRILYWILGLIPIIIVYLLLTQFFSISSLKVYENGFVRPTPGFPIIIDLKSKYIPYENIDKLDITGGYVTVILNRTEKNSSIKFPISALNIPLENFIDILKPFVSIDYQNPT